MAQRPKLIGTSRAQGMVLIISLLFLLILTIVATASMNTSLMEEKMAANNQYKTVSFQIAESAIQRYWIIDELERSWNYAARDYAFEEAIGNAYDPLKDGSVITQAAAIINYCGERNSFDAGGLNADQSLAVPVVKLHVFDVTGRGEVAAINARTVNERRGGYLKPSANYKRCEQLLAR